MDPEQIIIERAQNGSLDSFSLLVKTHQDAIRAFVAARLNNRSEAEDLAQEVFLVAWNKLTDYDYSASFRAWLRGIAHNLVRNHWRKHRPIAVGAGMELEILMREQIGKDDSAAADRLEALKACYASIGDESRNIIQWRYHDQLSIADICRRLGRQHSAVTMMLHRIRQSLRSCIQMQVNP